MPEQEPILFLWDLSAWAAKITAYFALRGIPYSRCEQPITQPRPDLAALGVNYRRIPVLSMGRDIYCDTLLIIEKLEQFYPKEKYKQISATNPTDKALERLLEKWTDVVVFKSAAACISTDLDLMKDPKFQKDRESLWGRSWSKEHQDALRPAALAEMRSNWDFLEDLLSDGRQWILGGSDGPKLADIHACWIFDWLLMLPGSFDENFFNESRYPHLLTWRTRYTTTITRAKSTLPPAPSLPSPTCISQILHSDFHEDSSVPTNLENDDPDPDPSGLKPGQRIRIAPRDTGFLCADEGKLVKLTGEEAVIGTVTMEEGKEVRIHFPRWNFRVEVVGGGERV